MQLRNEKLRCTHLPRVRLPKTFGKRPMVNLPRFHLALPASCEDQLLFNIDVHGPDLRAMRDERLNTVLRRKMPELEECVLRSSQEKPRSDTSGR